MAVAKQIPLRDASPPLPARFKPATLNDTANLFDGSEKGAARTARLSSASIVYSVDKSTTDRAGLLLRGAEKQKLEELHASRSADSENDRSCPHCRLLFDTLYSGEEWKNRPPPIAILNHAARVNIQFDPETYISSAKISDFMILVPDGIARAMLRLSHPLLWAESPEGLFRRSDPVESNGKRYDPETVKDPALEWQRRTREGQPRNGGKPDKDVFIYEDVAWPINQDLSADSENIIRITNFDAQGRGVDAGDLGQLQLDRLSYEYSLERCVRTNFGTAWEPSGLDIDGGQYSGRIVRLGEVHDALRWEGPDAADTDDQKRHKDETWPKYLAKRNVVEMRAAAAAKGNDHNWEALLEKVNLESKKEWLKGENWAPRPYEQLIHGLNGMEDRIESAEFAGSIDCLGNTLQDTWKQDFVLVTISASKELHFTLPENSPMALWQSLTWTAPAFLFTFLNAAVCQTPHLLIQQWMDEGKFP
jgi:hypothetical protein